MIEILKGIAMMAGAVIGMVLLIAGISLAIFAPLIVIVCLLIKAFA
jgi:hypothetical protein